jgi:ankyrin repeat protein
MNDSSSSSENIHKFINRDIDVGSIEAAGAGAGSGAAVDSKDNIKKFVVQIQLKDYSAIDDAIKRNSVEAMNKALVANPKLIDLKNYRGKGNLLHYTITKGDYPKLIQCLIKNGVDTNLTNSDGQTPYQYAKSIDSRSYSDSRSYTILYFEAYFEELKEIEELKKKLDTGILETTGGINVSNIEATRPAAAVDSKKDNITKFVQNNGDISTSLKMLDEEGIISDIDIKDSDWRDGTALMYQVAHGTVASMNLLLMRGANVNLQDSTGWTALHYAAFVDDSEKTKLLLDNGAGKTIRNNNKETALDLAIAYKDKNCIDLLKNYVPKSKVGGARRNKSRKSRKSKKSKKSKKSRKSRK